MLRAPVTCSRCVPAACLLQYKTMSVSIQKYITGHGSVQIARSIEKAVREGAVAPGDRLPTVRALADRLTVSPATVAAAYRALRERGIVSGQGRRGTVVSAAPPVSTPLAVSVPDGVRNLVDGNPDRDLLPDLRPALAKLEGAQRMYGGDIKSDALLRLAAARLAADGIAAGSLAIVGGALDGIERVLQVHLRPGDRVIVEDPGFIGVLDLLRALGLVAVAVAVDDAGVVPDELEAALEAGADALIVTPRAQNPMGAAIDAGRARALRRVLGAHPDLLVIEDDHAAGVAGAPLESLVDKKRSRWAFARSVSKSLGPDLRLAVLAGDSQTVSRVEGRQTMGIRWVSRILQDLVVALWSDRSVDRLLLRAERAYTERRQGLLDELAARGIEAFGRSGMNVWVPVADESSVVLRLRDEGWAVAPGERFRLGTAAAIRVTTSTLRRDDAARFAGALASILAPGGAQSVA